MQFEGNFSQIGWTWDAQNPANTGFQLPTSTGYRISEPSAVATQKIATADRSSSDVRSGCKSLECQKKMGASEFLVVSW